MKNEYNKEDKNAKVIIENSGIHNCIFKIIKIAKYTLTNIDFLCIQIVIHRIAK